MSLQQPRCCSKHHYRMASGGEEVQREALGSQEGLGGRGCWATQKGLWDILIPLWGALGPSTSFRLSFGSLDVGHFCATTQSKCPLWVSSVGKVLSPEHHLP